MVLMKGCSRFLRVSLVGILLVMSFIGVSAQTTPDTYYTFARGGNWKNRWAWTKSPSGTEMRPRGGLGVPTGAVRVVILPTATPIVVDADIEADGMEIEIRPGARLDMGQHKFIGKPKSISGGGSLP